MHCGEMASVKRGETQLKGSWSGPSSPREGIQSLRQLLETCPCLPSPVEGITAISVGLVQGNDVWPAAREHRVATYCPVVSVALSQCAGGDDAADAATSRADGAVRSCHHGGQGIHVYEVARRASVLEEMAKCVLLIQGGDHGRAVMLPSKGKPLISLPYPQNPGPRPRQPFREGTRSQRGQVAQGSLPELPRSMYQFTKTGPEPLTPTASCQHNPVQAQASDVRMAEKRHAAAARNKAQHSERRWSLQ